MAKKKKESKSADDFFAKYESRNVAVRQSQRRIRGWVDPEKKVLVPGEHVVRLIGERHDKMEMWVECADGRRRPVHLDDDHVLLRLYSKAMEGERKETLVDGKPKSKMEYFHAGTRTFETVEKWDPRRIYLWNVIDRDDKWCVQNKFCKILTTSEKSKSFGPALDHGRKGNGGIKFVIGDNAPTVPEDYDIKIVRTGKGINTEYQVAIPNKARTPQARDGKLTKAEREYGRYDLADLVRTTSNERVVEWLGDVIKQADADLGTDFCTELGMRKAGRRGGKKNGKANGTS